MKHTPWTRAATTGPLHDHLVTVVPRGADEVARALAGRLAGRAGVGGGPVQVHGLDEPADARLGNLGGTLRAWRWLGDRLPGLRARVEAGERVLILQDAGAATRSSPWSLALHGRRGDLPVGRMTLREATALMMAPLAVSGLGVVDVAWTSQLLLPGIDPADIQPPRAALTKLVATWSGGRPSPDAARELGWFGLDPLRFAPGGTLADPAAWAAWAQGGAVATDVGSFRATPALLDHLAQSDLPLPLDLDPGLTGPVLAGRSPVTPAPSVGVLPVDPLAWWRLRRPAEVWAFLRAMAAEGTAGDALRALVGLDRPLVGCTLGGRTGDAIDWAEVRAGVTVGGVFVRDAVLVDCALEGGAVEGSTAVGLHGTCQVAQAAVAHARDLVAQEALVLAADGVTAAGEVVVGLDDAVVRLGLGADPRAVDEVVVAPNTASFADLRRRLDG